MAVVILHVHKYGKKRKKEKERKKKKGKRKKEEKRCVQRGLILLLYAREPLFRC